MFTEYDPAIDNVDERTPVCLGCGSALDEDEAYYFGEWCASCKEKVTDDAR